MDIDANLWWICELLIFINIKNYDWSVSTNMNNDIFNKHKKTWWKHKTQKIMLKNGQNVNLIKNTNDKKNQKIYISFCVSCLRP